MGTPGVKYVYEKVKIVEALKESKGRITVACKKLNIDYQTLKKVIDKEPELEELLKNLRDDFENTLLDMAESTIQRAMSKAELDPNNAMKAAMYTLNSKGNSRGWSNTLSNASQTHIPNFKDNFPNDSGNPVKILSESVSDSSDISPQ